MRARKKSWTERELSINPKLVSEPAEYKCRWAEYFGNSNPIHVEIGCGKGRFIIETARQSSDINCLAVEREEHVIVSGMRAAREQDVRLGFILGDVASLPDIFGDGELSRIYINFCDPWPGKKKWAKRRLTHRSFLDMYRRLLRTDGSIYFKTDNRELFEFSLNEFCGSSWTLKNISLDLHKIGLDGNIMTEYEEKFSSQGLPIYRLEAYL